MQLMKFEKDLFASTSMTPDDLPYVRRLLTLACLRPVEPKPAALSHEEGIKWAETIVTEEILNRVYLQVTGTKPPPPSHFPHSLPPLACLRLVEPKPAALSHEEG